MNAKILICIPIRNRFEIARECIPTVKAGAAGCDDIAVFDDGSDGQAPIEAMGNWYSYSTQIGIEKQRRNHFTFFKRRLDCGDEFTHLYLTDADALHDPNWRSEALRLQDLAGGAPVCLYNTQAHARLIGNTIEDDKSGPIIWRRVAPGISYLLTADHVRRVNEAIIHMPDPLHWDWTVPAILGHRMAIARTSYVDHVGNLGLHHPAQEGWDGGDRATSPTDWLVRKRAEVVAKLKSNG